MPKVVFRLDLGGKIVGKKRKRRKKKPILLFYGMEWN